MRISKLVPPKQADARWLCHLEDGTVLPLSGNEVAAFGLCSGLELTEEQLEKIMQAARFARVRDRAMDLLSTRPMSRKELVDKLTARPRGREKTPLADPETARVVADRLEELGYLNDQAYAHTVAEYYSAKGCGPSRIREALYHRGVPRELWSEVLDDLDAPDAAIDAFLQKKLRGVDLTDPRSYKRAADALARRGFRWEDIQDGLRRYGRSMEENL